MIKYWKKWGNNAIAFTDEKDLKKIAIREGYSISKSIVNKKTVYELWKLPEQINLGIFNSADEAKQFHMDAIKK